MCFWYRALQVQLGWIAIEVSERERAHATPQDRIPIAMWPEWERKLNHVLGTLN